MTNLKTELIRTDKLSYLRRLLFHGIVASLSLGFLNGCGGSGADGEASLAGVVHVTMELAMDALPAGADCPDEILDYAERSQFTGRANIYAFDLWPVPTNLNGPFVYAVDRIAHSIENVQMNGSPPRFEIPNLPIDTELWLTASWVPYSVPAAPQETADLSGKYYIWSSGVCGEDNCSDAANLKNGVPSFILESSTPLEVTVRLNAVTLQKNYSDASSCL